MKKMGKMKTYKIKCSECENKFEANADDFVMTRNVRWQTLYPMIKCPYCKSYLYKNFGFMGIKTIWELPYWEFEVVDEV